MSNGEIDLDSNTDIVLPDTALASFRSDELGQIRNLLLGEHAQQMLERVERVESEVLVALTELRDHVDARFGEVESELAAEVDIRKNVGASLVTRIDEEAQARRDAQIDLRFAVERSTEQITDQLKAQRSELADRIESTNADMRERDLEVRRRQVELGERTDGLQERSDELQERSDELRERSDELRERSDELRERSVDRELLAKLFTTAAIDLTTTND